MRDLTRGVIQGGCTAVKGLDTAFSNRVRRTKGESGGSSYSTLLTYSKFYATRLEATLLQIRPMGTYRGSLAADPTWSLASDPTWGVLQFSLIPLQSDFIEVYKGTGNMDLVMVKIPGRFTADGLASLGFKSIKNGGVTRPALQDEAHQLLLDLPIPHQTVSDLSLVRGPTPVNPPTRTLDQFFNIPRRSTIPATVPRVGEADKQDVAQDHAEFTVPGPSRRALLKPTNVQFKE